MALIDKYATPKDKLLVILEGMTMAQLRLILRFAEFLVKEGKNGGPG